MFWLKSYHISRILFLLCVFIILLTSFSQAAPPRPKATNIRLAETLGPGREVVLRADPNYSGFRIAAPAGFNRRVSSARINVSYNPDSCEGNVTTWDAEAQTAFQTAVDIWATLIESPVPIEVHACWTVLEAGILGSAGPAGYATAKGDPNNPDDDTSYPIALGNMIAGEDRFPEGPDIYANFNSRFTNWYFGTDGNPDSREYDFLTAVLHELGHGLGFIGAFVYNDGSRSTQGYCGGVIGHGCIVPGNKNVPDIFDRFTENGDGVPLLDFPRPSAELGHQLTSDNLFFNSPNAKALNEEQPVKLYAPSSWKPGSSYTHLDEIFNNTPHALMTFSLSQGEALHHPGSIALAMLQDMGWAVNKPEVSLSLTKTASAEVVAGRSLDYTLRLTNSGDADATQIVLRDELPNGLVLDQTSLSDEATVIGQTISWNIKGALAPGATLERTFRVIVEAEVSHDTMIINKAFVTTAQTPEMNAVATTRIIGPPELVLEKIAPSTTILGQPIIYLLRLTNIGHSQASDIILRDELPPGLTLDSTSLSHDAAIQGNLITWTTNASLGPNDRLERQFRSQVKASVNSRDVIINQATASASENIQASAIAITTAFSPPILSIRKTVDTKRLPVHQGDTITYTIILQNNGDTLASDVQVVDILPDFVVGGDFFATTNLPGHEAAKGEIVATLSQDAPFETWITNTATFSYQNQYGSASVGFKTKAPPPPELYLAKTASQSYIKAGESLRYTLSVSNASLGAASGVTLIDSVPLSSSLQPTSVSHQGVLRGGRVLSWSLPLLDSTTVITRSFEVIVSPALSTGMVITNTAFLLTDTSGLDVNDPSSILVTSARHRAIVTTTVDNMPPVFTTFGKGPLALSPLITPTLGVYITHTIAPIFRWHAAEDNYGQIAYTIFISRVQPMRQIDTGKLSGTGTFQFVDIYSDTTDQTTYPVQKFLPNGHYHWAIQASDVAGNVTGTGFLTSQAFQIEVDYQFIYLPLMIK